MKSISLVAIIVAFAASAHAADKKRNPAQANGCAGAIYKARMATGDVETKNAADAAITTCKSEFQNSHTKFQKHAAAVTISLCKTGINDSSDGADLALDQCQVDAYDLALQVQ